MAINTQNVSAITLPGTNTYQSIGDNAVTFMSVCNHSASPVNIDIHIVPNGGGAGTDNLLVSALEIIADDTYIVYQGNEKLFLSNGDRIEIVASVANVVTVITSYVTI